MHSPTTRCPGVWRGLFNQRQSKFWPHEEILMHLAAKSKLESISCTKQFINLRNSMGKQNNSNFWKQNSKIPNFHYCRGLHKSTVRHCHSLSDQTVRQCSFRYCRGLQKCIVRHCHSVLFWTVRQSSFPSKKKILLKNKSTKQIKCSDGVNFHPGGEIKDRSGQKTKKTKDFKSWFIDENQKFKRTFPNGVAISVAG